MLQPVKVWKDLTVSQELIDVYSSGTSAYGDTVAGAFDVQPRSLALITETVFEITNSSNAPIPDSHYSQLVLLDNKIEAFEGLILDTRIGHASVGFRNHTLPESTPFGGTWKEVKRLDL
jgi:hypothetical protein